MWTNRKFWQRLVATLLTATEEGRLQWEDTPEEPTLRAIFADGMIHLLLPEGAGRPPELVAFDRWHLTTGTFRPEETDDVGLVERLYQLAGRNYRPFGEPFPPPKDGELIELQPVLRSIEAELANPKARDALGARSRR